MNLFRYSLLPLALAFLIPAISNAQETDFETLDTDKDGIVTPKEFIEYATPKLGGFDKIEEFADRVDADEDGQISELEFLNRRAILQEMATELQQNPNGDRSEEEVEMIKAATEAYNSISEMVNNEEWDDMGNMMTQEGADTYAFTMVAQGVALATMELPPQMQIPALTEAKKKMSELIEIYGLDELDFASVINIQVDGQRVPAGGQKKEAGDEDKADDEEGDDDMTPSEKRRAKMDELRGQVIEKLDEDDKRWEIVAAFHEAKLNTPLDRKILSRRVAGTDIEDEEVFLVVQGDNAGARVPTPPTVVKMVKGDNDQWQFDGVDLQRTRSAAQQFLQRLQRSRQQQQQQRGGTDF